MTDNILLPSDDQSDDQSDEQSNDQSNDQSDNHLLHISTESVLIDVNKVCPPSTKINTSNNHLPSPKLLGFDEMYSVLKYWYEFNCAKLQIDTNEIPPVIPNEQNPPSCVFHSIGQHLLHHAIQRNETLLTVQIGAMDGISNDPMYEMFVLEGRKKQKHVGVVDSFNDLRNWLPVMIEPVPVNYEALIETYTDKIAITKGLACAVPINAAVSYTSTSTSADTENNKTCPFCRVNTANDTPKRCSEMRNWEKFQIGSLDCNYSKFLFGESLFNTCFIQDPLPCTTITNLLAERFLSNENIGMLQIDIEGYEYILLEGFMEELPDQFLPPIIHFERKVMAEQDKKYPLGDGNKRLKSVEDLMMSKGYVLHHEGEDFLAIRVSGIRAHANMSG